MALEHLLAFFPIVSLLVNVMLQVFIFRTFLKRRLLKSIFIGFLAGFIFLILLQFSIIFSSSIKTSDFFGALILSLLTYSSLGYCYFHFINLGETARRIRILRELYEFKEGLTEEEILKRYNAREIVDKRLSRLLKNKQIILREGRYHIGNPIMFLIAKIMTGLKVLLLGKKSEYD